MDVEIAFGYLHSLFIIACIYHYSSSKMKYTSIAALIALAFGARSCSARPPVVNRICVANQAGFVLHWEMKDLLNNNKSPDSGTYPIDQTRCQGVDTIASIAEGDIVQTTVHAVAGISHDTDVIQFSANASATATYTCTGTTLDYSCTLN